MSRMKCSNVWGLVKIEQMQMEMKLPSKTSTTLKVLNIPRNKWRLVEHEILHTSKKISSMGFKFLIYFTDISIYLCYSTAVKYGKDREKMNENKLDKELSSKEV